MGAVSLKQSIESGINNSVVASKGRHSNRAGEIFPLACRHRLVVRTRPFQGRDAGSSPNGDIRRLKMTESESLLMLCLLSNLGWVALSLWINESWYNLMNKHNKEWTDLINKLLKK